MSTKAERFKYVAERTKPLPDSYEAQLAPFLPAGLRAPRPAAGRA